VPKLLLDTRAEYTIPRVYRGTAAPEIVSIPCYKLYVRMYLVPPGEERGWRPPPQFRQERLFDAIVDTGASLTNLPHGVWSEIAGSDGGEVRDLELAERETVSLGGRTHTFRLGRVLLAAMDWRGRWMPPAWTTVRCLDETDDPPPALLGLLSPFLMAHHRIRHAGEARRPNGDTHPEWWLEG
jgi:hypothetical protein